MPSRRPHVKSRHGCSQCKTRKVKCDQQKPVCGNCSRREQQCSFAASYPATALSLANSLDASSKAADPFTTPVYTSRDMGLMHHWITVSYHTIADEPSLHDMWRLQAPKEALRHPYLMNCILAVSALHLVQTTPLSSQEQDAYRTLAVRYHDSALTAFRPLLGNITRDNCDAIFACSALLVICAAAFPLLPGIVEHPPPSGTIVETCELVKGVSLVVEAARPLLEVGKMAPVLDLAPQGGVPSLTEEVSDALRNLRMAVDALPATNLDKAIYQRALDSLETAFSVSSLQPGRANLTFFWLVIVERHYIELVKIKEPMALVILCHYAVILHSQRNQWWLGDRGHGIVKEVHDIVERSWRPLMHWPMWQVGLITPGLAVTPAASNDTTSPGQATDYPTPAYTYSPSAGLEAPALGPSS